MTLKVRIQHKFSDDKSIAVYSTEALDDVGRLAVVLIERWGLVAAMPDGEDSAGRARLRLPTATELVDRAFDIAERSWAVARERAHVIDVPDLNEINAEADAKQASLDASKRA